MLYYDKIDLSEGNEDVKSNNGKEYVVCHCWFFNHEFKFQGAICNGCHDLMMSFLNLTDIDIVTGRNVDCCCVYQ